MKAIISLFLFYSFSVFSAGPGFKSGDHFQSHNLVGDISVSCPSLRARYSCRDYFLTPTMRDHFVYTDAPESDKVTLTAYHLRGTERTKNERFQEGRSRSTINLWISSLFQRPLLEVGENRVRYSMEKSGEVVEVGEFEVIVERMPTKYCPHRTYFASSDHYCRNQAATMCARYFNEISRSCR